MQSQTLSEVPRGDSRRAVTALSVGHFSVDFFQGCVPAILPYLVSERHYTLAAVGSLVFAFNLASSVVQPMFGWMADRFTVHWLIPAGLLLSGVGVALVGNLQTSFAMLVVAMFAGIGVAAFHPEAARLVRGVSGRQKATAMSLFAMGGASGFAVGPLVASGLFATLGLRQGSLALLVPLALLLAYSVWELPFIHRTQQAATAAESAVRASHGGQETTARAGDRWGAFGLLCVAIMARSVIFFSMSTFLPLFWLKELHGTEAGGGRLVSVLFLFGVLGAYVGGRCGDRFGHRRVVLGGFIAMLPILAALPHLAGAGLVAGVALMGACIYLPYSVLVVMGQEHLPNHVGLASGVTLGLTVTLGGLVTPLLGRFADAHGIGMMFTALLTMPALALIVSWLMPTASGAGVEPVVLPGATRAALDPSTAGAGTVG